MPFGEEIQPDTMYRTSVLKYGVGDNVRQKFTGYERDDETGLDFAEARYYVNNHGRFTAVDPLIASGKSADPQTFNRYAYAMSRPLIFTDSTGLQAGQPVKGKNDSPWYKKPMVRDDDPEEIENDAVLTTIFTDTGTVLGDSAPMYSSGFNHYKFDDENKLHTIHIYGNESMNSDAGDAGVYIPKEFSVLKITSKDTVIATNPNTGAQIMINHVQVGEKEKGSQTNRTLRGNIKTVRGNGTMYIGKIGGKGGEGQKEFSGRGRHAHLVFFPNEAARLAATRSKAASGGTNRLPEYMPKDSRSLGDFKYFKRTH
jgi:RHS repeat-associated protein